MLSYGMPTSGNTGRTWSRWRALTRPYWLEKRRSWTAHDHGASRTLPTTSGPSTDGDKASGERVEKAYWRSGTFSEILKIADDHGGAAYDFETVNVPDPKHPDQVPPSIQAAYWPTMGITPGQPVTFKVRTFGTTDGEESWSFGGSATAITRSDGNVEEHAKNGFAAATHAFNKPGDYIVRVKRLNRLDQKAIVYLWVRVGEGNIP